MTFNSLHHRLAPLIGICLIAMLTRALSHVFLQIDSLKPRTTRLYCCSPTMSITPSAAWKGFHAATRHPIRESVCSPSKKSWRQARRAWIFFKLGFSRATVRFNSLSSKQYPEQFSDLIDLRLAIESNESSGQQGEFRRDMHDLEQALKVKNLKSLSLLLLQLRHHEKDFLLQLVLCYTIPGQQT